VAFNTHPSGAGESLPATWESSVCHARFAVSKLGGKQGSPWF